MRLLVLFFLIGGLLAGCLPDVSMEFKELEARTALEREVLDLCVNRQSSSRISMTLRSIDDAIAVPSRHHWTFYLELPDTGTELQALVFPSGSVSGSYIRHMRIQECR